MIIFLKVPSEKKVHEHLFCVELSSPQCLIKKKLAKKLIYFYQNKPPGLEGLLNKTKNGLKTSRERGNFQILPTDGARAYWQIGLDTRQLCRQAW